MRNLRNIVVALAAAGCVFAVPSAFSQNRGGSGMNNHRQSGSVTTSRPATQSRPSGATRPTNQTQVRPGNGGSVARPGSATVRPGSSTQSRPAVSTRPATQSRPGNSGQVGRPPTQTRPGGSVNRPGNSGSVNRPPASNRPGVRPSRLGGHWGSSVPRPGVSGNWANYRPMRPGGGYWGAPPVNIYRPVFVLPPVPRRYTAVRVGVPTIGGVLGLAFGSLIDAGINTLIGGGYDVIGYANNAVYLQNVAQLGYTWPEATVYYNNGLMANTQFQYWTPTSSMSRFNLVYNQLCGLYGMPVEDSYVNGMRTVSWWGGSNDGYVTLQYGFGSSAAGYGNYYTTLTYGQ